MSEVIQISHTGIKPVISLALVPGNDPTLKEIMPDFVFGRDNAVVTANALIDALERHGGLGLAAPQIGMRKRCFVAGPKDNVVSYFNPKVISFSEETELQEEGCLSYPGLKIKIRRPFSIVLEYQDYEGQLIRRRFDGLTARILQHEVDHLNGITFKERAGKMALQLAMKKWKKTNV
jgi:peptide deformylase